jgi:hypothetical protein
MYCSICGNALSPHLNYCNHCGARSEKDKPEQSNSPSGWVALSGALLAAFGLFFAVNLLRMLLDSRLDTSAIVIILICYLVTVMVMFSVFIRHMSKGSRETRSGRRELQSGQAYEPPPSSFRRVNTKQLEPAGEPGSITEHTTRTLDEVLVEHK